MYNKNEKIYHRGKYKTSNNYNFNVRSLEPYSSRWLNIGRVLAMYRASIVSTLLTFVHRSSTVAVTSPVLTAHSPRQLLSFLVVKIVDTPWVRSLRANISLSWPLYCNIKRGRRSLLFYTAFPSPESCWLIGLARAGGNRSKERDRKSELVLRSTYQIFEWDRNNSDRNFYNVVRYVHIPLVP